MSQKISIITPTLNSGEFIGKNLKSVHLTRNKSMDIEQIIVDGMSNDNTLDIIEGFRDENNANIRIMVGKDRSMYEAINKALESGVGEIWACLNSDDAYFPGTLEKICAEFANQPEIDVVYCPLVFDYGSGRKRILYFPPFDLDYLIQKKCPINITQPSTFLRNQVLRKVGFFNTQYKYASDYDYLIRVGSSCKLKYLPHPATLFSTRSSSISETPMSGATATRESEIISQLYSKKLSIPYRNTFFQDRMYLAHQFKPVNFPYFIRRLKQKIFR